MEPDTLKYSEFELERGYDIYGKTISFPPEIEELILKRQVEAGNKPNIKVFYKDSRTGKTHGGFDFVNTIEGIEFWRTVIFKRDYTRFYKLYPNHSTSNQLEYKGKIHDYPKEIVDRILELISDDKPLKSINETKLQCLERLGVGGCFNWDSSEEGGDFWMDINNKKFETFFNKYPKGTQTSTNNETKNKSTDESSSIINREQPRQGSAFARASNCPREITIASKLIGNTAQNRITKRGFESCQIQRGIEFR